MLKHSILLSTSAILALSVATPAIAQDEDEIIVTATKRAQTLQEVPVAVTVTSSDTIEKAQILDISDLQSVVPSLRVTTLQTAANTNFIIRGFGNGANNAGIEPSVGVFIDGVYRSRSAAQIGDLPKLERIEVLRGPQSTLFGKNASAGVLSVVSAKPSFTPEAYVEGGYGNYSMFNFKGYATGALSDDFAVSIGAGLNQRNGYSPQAIDGLEGSNDRDRFNVRAQALYEPSDTVSLRLIADYSSIDEICCAVTNVQNQGASAAIAALGGQFANDLDVFGRTSFVNREANNFVDDMGLSFHADIDLDWATLTSITSLRNNESGYDSDADYNTLDLLASVREDRELTTFTQEVRLTSNNTDGMLDWMVGGYFFSEDIEQIGGLTYGTDLQSYFNVLLQQAGAPAGLLGTLEGLYGAPAGSYLGAGVSTREAFTQDNLAYSAFGTLDFHVSDRLTATVGLNYTVDDKQIRSNVVNGDVFSSLDLVNDNTLLGVPLPTVFFGQIFQAQTGLAPTPANIAFIEGIAPGTSAAVQAGANGLVAGIQTTQFQPQFVNFPNAVESGETNDDKVTYSIRLAYEVSDALNVYANYSTGFKATSWNLGRDSRPFAADQAAIVAAGLNQNNQVYRTRFAGPEEARVIEAGLKAKFDNGAINVSIFDQNIEGFQSNEFLGTGFTLLNAGEQQTRGAEIEGTYRVADALTLSGALTYLDAKYEEFTAAQGASVGGVPTDLSGERVSGVPEFSLSLGALYNHEFNNGMRGYVRGDFQYESPVQIVDGIPTVTNSAGTTFDLEREIKTVNASMGLDLDNGIELSVWARNLFNDEYLLSAFPGVAQTGIINSYASAPRTYGIKARYTFD